MGGRKLVYGVGVNDFCGKVTYVSSEGKQKKFRWYEAWKGIMERCYGDHSVRNLSYENCTVCDDWKSLSKFKTWHDKYYVEGFYLDKDLIVPTNTLYSPEMCTFVPNHINCLFISRTKARGVYKKGVSIDKRSGKFCANMSTPEGTIWIGSYSTEDDAYQAYINRKVIYCGDILIKYRGVLEDTFLDNIANNLVYFIENSK